MAATDFFWHVASFVAPAFWLGLALAAWGWGMNRLTAHVPGDLGVRSRWRRSLLLDWAIGIAVLCAGLIMTGHDGRMMTYGALALAVAARRCWVNGPNRR